MKCPECGSEVSSDEKFCGNCGAPLEGGESAPGGPAEMPVTNETVVAEAPLLAASEPEDMPPLAAPDLEPSPPPPAPPAAKTTDKKVIWIIVAAVVIVLLCCCCALAFLVIFSEDISSAVEDLAMVVPQVLSII